MNRVTVLFSNRIAGVVWMCLASGFPWIGFLCAAAAQDSSPRTHLSVTEPGGMPALPVLTGIERASNGFRVTWYGPPGYGQLFQKRDLSQLDWQPVGGLSLSHEAFLAGARASGFFRVSAPAPQYAGVRACSECHAEIHASVAHTAHLGAFTVGRFQALGGQTNASCLSCHTVGFGQPSGFVSKAKTPQLGGVQCENCHGSAARHAANPDDATARPRIEIASTLCGGCHTAKSVPLQVKNIHPAYYEDWNASGHRAVSPVLAKGFTGELGFSTAIASCGRCHSGTVREALVEETPLPNGHEAGAVGIACSTCHDAHSQYVHTNVLSGITAFTNPLTGFTLQITNTLLGPLYTNQLRESLASVVDFHSTDDFSADANPNINLCAQCHNDRGASWTDGDRPPHRSPQYNMLLGTVGELETRPPRGAPATHSRLEKQCVTCHMQTSGHTSGHTFGVTSYDTCAKCHGSAINAQNFAGFVKSVVTNLSQKVKQSLDEWALTRSAVELRRYGRLAWEYQTPGELSDPTGELNGPVSDPTHSGLDEQRYIPVNIRKARHNLYVVVHDGSYGVHNGPYTVALLNAAQTWIQTELEQ